MHLHSRVKRLPHGPVLRVLEEDVRFDRVLEEGVDSGANAGDGVCPEAGFGVDGVAEEVGAGVAAVVDFDEGAVGDAFVGWISG